MIMNTYLIDYISSDEVDVTSAEYWTPLQLVYLLDLYHEDFSLEDIVNAINEDIIDEMNEEKMLDDINFIPFEYKTLRQIKEKIEEVLYSGRGYNPYGPHNIKWNEEEIKALQLMASFDMDSTPDDGPFMSPLEITDRLNFLYNNNRSVKDVIERLTMALFNINQKDVAKLKDSDWTTDNKYANYWFFASKDVLVDFGSPEDVITANNSLFRYEEQKEDIMASLKHYYDVFYKHPDQIKYF